VQLSLKPRQGLLALRADLGLQTAVDEVPDACFSNKRDRGWLRIDVIRPWKVLDEVPDTCFSNENAEHVLAEDCETDHAR
jgi:hypothetical protein